MTDERIREIQERRRSSAASPVTRPKVLSRAAAINEGLLDSNTRRNNMTSIAIGYDDFNDEPTEAELSAIENGEDPFSDPDWHTDKEVDLDYPGSEYDFDFPDPYGEYDQ